MFPGFNHSIQILQVQLHADQETYQLMGKELSSKIFTWALILKRSSKKDGFLLVSFEEFNRKRACPYHIKSLERHWLAYWMDFGTGDYFFSLNIFLGTSSFITNSLWQELGWFGDQRSGCLGSTLAIMKKSSKFLPVSLLIHFYDGMLSHD